jgi:uncharacterized protein (DUF4415 family)
MNADDTVTVQFDPTAPRRALTPGEAAQLEALEGREPDTGDIPQAPEANWAAAVRGRFFKPRKQAISLRLDMDVLAWLRGKGTRYQSEINRILRERMETETGGHWQGLAPAPLHGVADSSAPPPVPPDDGIGQPE